jgi:hypothetical protein
LATNLCPLLSAAIIDDIADFLLFFEMALSLKKDFRINISRPPK